MADSTPCLDADTAAAWAARALTDAERAQVEAHIDGCASCRQLLSALALGDHTADTSPSRDATGLGLVLPRGARIGPYEIERPLDAGGMGLVYVARDTRLQRRVALKGVREHRADQHRELLQEATAMARLQHPNVVQVFDVIEAFEQTFFAMELVVGSSARQWLEARPRSSREVLEVFLQAGEGIAAAHDAGLVHRDVKPANILVGDDGRVRITDFGIASPSSDAQEKIRGTPAYMAPEVAGGLQSDDKSDQYSFALALQQALPQVDPTLDRVLRRALSPEPAQRFPSMHALLEAIRATQRRGWARWVVAAALLLAAGVGAAYLAGRSQREAEACARPPVELVGFWNDPARDQVRAGFEKTQVPWAGDAFDRVDAAVKAWVERFSAVRRQSCEATWIDKRQSQDVLIAQMRCLTSRFREARATLDELKVADAALVSDPVGATWQPARLDACLEVDTPALPEPAEHVALRESLAAIRAKNETGKNKDALAAATELLPRALASNDRLIQAEAYLRLGVSQTRTSAYDKAGENLKQSLRLADAAGDDVARGNASVALMQSEFWQGHFDQVLFLGDLTLGATERAHDEGLLSDVLMMMGASLAERDRPDEARQHLERSLKLRQKIFGPDDRRVAAVQSALGNLRSMRGELEDGLALHRQALETMRAAVGERHPMYGRQFFNTGADLMAMQRPKEALVELSRALSVLEAAEGGSHRDVAIALCELGAAQLESGDPVAARASLERGEASWAQVSPKNPKRAACLVTLSKVEPVPLERLELAYALAPKAEAAFALAQAMTTGAKVGPRAVELARAAQTQWKASKLPRDTVELARCEAWLRAHGETP